MTILEMFGIGSRSTTSTHPDIKALSMSGLAAGGALLQSLCPNVTFSNDATTVDTVLQRQLTLSNMDAWRRSSGLKRNIFLSDQHFLLFRLLLLP